MKTTKKRHDFLAIGELKKKGKESSILLSAALNESQVRQYFGDSIERVREVNWDVEEKKVTAFEFEKLGAIVLKRYFVKDLSKEEKRKVFLEALKKDIELLPWDEESLQWVERVLTVKNWSARTRHTISRVP